MLAHFSNDCHFVFDIVILIGMLPHGFGSPLSRRRIQALSHQGHVYGILERDPKPLKLVCPVLCKWRGIFCSHWSRLGFNPLLLSLACNEFCWRRASMRNGRWVPSYLTPQPWRWAFCSLLGAVTNDSPPPKGVSTFPLQSTESAVKQTHSKKRYSLSSGTPYT